MRVLVGQQSLQCTVTSKRLPGEKLIRCPYCGAAPRNTRMADTKVLDTYMVSDVRSYECGTKILLPVMYMVSYIFRGGQCVSNEVISNLTDTKEDII